MTARSQGNNAKPPASTAELSDLLTAPRSSAALTPPPTTRVGLSWRPKTCVPASTITESNAILDPCLRPAPPPSDAPLSIGLAFRALEKRRSSATSSPFVAQPDIEDDLFVAAMLGGRTAASVRTVNNATRAPQCGYLFRNEVNLETNATNGVVSFVAVGFSGTAQHDHFDALPSLTRAAAATSSRPRRYFCTMWAEGQFDLTPHPLPSAAPNNTRSQRGGESSGQRTTSAAWQEDHRAAARGGDDRLLWNENAWSRGAAPPSSLDPRPAGVSFTSHPSSTFTHQHAFAVGWQLWNQWMAESARSHAMSSSSSSSLAADRRRHRQKEGEGTSAKRRDGSNDNDPASFNVNEEETSASRPRRTDGDADARGARWCTAREVLAPMGGRHGGSGGLVFGAASIPLPLPMDRKQQQRQHRSLQLYHRSGCRLRQFSREEVVGLLYLLSENNTRPILISGDSLMRQLFFTIVSYLRGQDEQPFEHAVGTAEITYVVYNTSSDAIIIRPRKEFKKPKPDRNGKVPVNALRRFRSGRQAPIFRYHKHTENDPILQLDFVWEITYDKAEPALVQPPMARANPSLFDNLVNMDAAAVAAARAAKTMSPLVTAPRGAHLRPTSTPLTPLPPLSFPPPITSPSPPPPSATDPPSTIPFRFETPAIHVAAFFYWLKRPLNLSHELNATERYLTHWNRFVFTDHYRDEEEGNAPFPLSAGTSSRFNYTLSSQWTQAAATVAETTTPSSVAARPKSLWRDPSAAWRTQRSSSRGGEAPPPRWYNNVTYRYFHVTAPPMEFLDETTFAINDVLSMRNDRIRSTVASWNAFRRGMTGPLPTIGISRPSDGVFPFSSSSSASAATSSSSLGFCGLLDWDAVLRAGDQQYEWSTSIMLLNRTLAYFNLTSDVRHKLLHRLSFQDENGTAELIDGLTHRGITTLFRAMVSRYSLERAQSTRQPPIAEDIARQPVKKAALNGRGHEDDNDGDDDDRLPRTVRPVSHWGAYRMDHLHFMCNFAPKFPANPTTSRVDRVGCGGDVNFALMQWLLHALWVTM